MFSIVCHVGEGRHENQGKYKKRGNNQRIETELYKGTLQTERPL